MLLETDEPSLVQPLLDSVAALSGPWTVILLAYDTAHGRCDAYGAFREHADVLFDWVDLAQAADGIKETVKLVRLILRSSTLTS